MIQTCFKHVRQFFKHSLTCLKHCFGNKHVSNIGTHGFEFKHVSNSLANAEAGPRVPFRCFARKGRPAAALPSSKPLASPAAALPSAGEEKEKKGDWLPAGFRVQVKKRKWGKSAGKEDTFYIGPDGKSYRSKKEVLGLDSTHR